MNRLKSICAGILSTIILILSFGAAQAQATPATCPLSVTSKSQISAACRTNALSLIKGAGYYNIQAYQQANGITSYASQTSTIGPKTYNWVMSGSKLNVTSPNSSDHVVVDVSEQLATYYHSGRAMVISRISTGSEKSYTYVSNGKTIKAVAHTRRGTSTIYRQEGALHKSADLGGQPGSMAWAEYFDGGIALHSGNLPGVPASHGCVRLDRGGSGSNDDSLKLMRDNGLGIGDKVTIQD